ncbi:endonuclease NucS [Oscillatoria amoena NRMC-F 0135]|nr:endonuclease NucS [Oscillatoria amoena NRMC-F 0135]
MLSGAALRKTGENWEFSSEFAFEDFIWDHLEQLMSLTPFSRQYAALGEICDILAVNREQQLHILELKNTEDRYIVQQLTRYFDNLISVTPFPELIDYNKSVKLIAIAPSFHRHNFIDRKYSKLEIDFFSFQVIERNDQFYLHLNQIENSKTYQVPIPYRKIELVSKPNLSPPPPLLLDWLGSCTGDEQEGILKMRDQILLFDGRIQEISENKKSIQYGKGKSRICAEFCWERKTQKPILFLWLPLPGLRQQEQIGRLRIWTDGKIVSYVGHVPDGLGKMKPMSEWEKIPLSQRPKFLMGSLSYKSHTPIEAEGYLRHKQLEMTSVSLESFVNLALEKWRQRL